MSKGEKQGPGDKPPKRAGGQRVDQEKIDQMVVLRRRGVSYEQIAAQVDCSVRTVQRYVKNVEPQLQIPQAGEQPERVPRVLRQQILRRIMDELFNDNQLAGLDLTQFDVAPEDEGRFEGPPAIQFLNEAERLLRAALQCCGDDTVRLIASAAGAQRMLVGETIGTLQADYRRWVFIMYHYYDGRTQGWGPPHSRSPQESAQLAKYDWLFRTILRIEEERR